MVSRVDNIPNPYILKEVTELDEIQNMLYAMMKDFHEICIEHNLCYTVFGGTLLGAVRHNGFIPWDDDIDVGMPRKDYELFCSIVEKYSDKYEMGYFPQKYHIFQYGKFYNKNTVLREGGLISSIPDTMLFIDVFPIDGYPPQCNEKKHFDKIRFLNICRDRAVTSIAPSKIWWKRQFTFFKYIIYPVYRIIGYSFFLKKMDEELKKYSFENSEYISMQGAGWNEKGKLKKEILLDRKLYKFGNIEVYGISDYDEHLTKLYGDYMTLPPEEKRQSHNYKLYVKEKETPHE